MKSKVFYNFLFDYDMDNLLLDLTQKSQLEDTNNRFNCEKNQSKKTNEILSLFLIFILFGSVIFILDAL